LSKLDPIFTGAGNLAYKLVEDMSNSVFITNVELFNYKSISRCNISLGSLTYLVGPNGAGKSNFLDAFRFTADALQTSLDHAIRDRGGIKEVRRRSGGHPTHFEMRFGFTLQSGQSGIYRFRIAAGRDGAYSVQYEECILHSMDVFGNDSKYRVENGIVVETTMPVAPAATPDRLYLVNASGLPEFRPVYDAFSRMAFYSLNPDRIRSLQSPDAGEVLKRDGSNLAGVFARIEKHSPETKHRIEEYLGKVVPGIEGIEAREIGPMETLEFRQKVRGSKFPWSFLAANMSDGTLRALGIIAALLQNYDPQAKPAPLAGIEEPEIALHPAAASILRDVLAEGSLNTQIIVTSHSPDLLDDIKILPESIIGVSSRDGETRLSPIGRVAKAAIKNELYTAGELLRLNQLIADDEELGQQNLLEVVEL